ncbi:MAG: hypothetical protein QOJ07_2067 [Thermoleophilaceae bacterium]|nr:hypothetical protein [Thermoleophilaceae bacterium]
MGEREPDAGAGGPGAAPQGDAALDLLEQVFAGAPVGLALMDTDLRYQRINGRLAEINGAAREDHIGRTPAEVIGPLGDEIVQRLRTVVTTGRPLDGVILGGRTPAEPGDDRSWVASYFPVTGGDGAVVGVGAVIAETTAQLTAVRRERDARATAEALVRASTAVSASMDPEDVLEALVRTSLPVFGDWCSVHVRTPGEEPRLAAVGHHDPARVPLARAVAERQGHREDGRVARTIATGRAMIYERISDAELEAAADDQEHLEQLRALGLVSGAVVPLAARGRVLGAMTVGFAESGRGYDSYLLQALEVLARQAALALDNAQLFAERVEIAHALQQSLLPRELPAIPGVDLAVRYRPAGRSNEVGGDCYDVFGDGPYAFMVADVVGKGPQAAALTALVRHTLRAAHLRGDDPVSALGLVNEALLAAPLPSRLCTAICGLLEVRPDGLALRIACAGHPPPLVRRAGGAVEEVGVGGLLLGVATDAEFEEVEVVLAPGDALVLYTDGATELRGADPRLGERLLREQLARPGRPSALELVEGVERAALVASEGDLRDDMALLALRADGETDRT